MHPSPQLCLHQEPVWTARVIWRVGASYWKRKEWKELQAESVLMQANENTTRLDVKGASNHSRVSPNHKLRILFSKHSKNLKYSLRTIQKMSITDRCLARWWSVLRMIKRLLIWQGRWKRMLADGDSVMMILRSWSVLTMNKLLRIRVIMSRRQRKETRFKGLIQHHLRNIMNRATIIKMPCPLRTTLKWALVWGKSLDPVDSNTLRNSIASC